jgi:cell division septation protein DedD
MAARRGKSQARRSGGSGGTPGWVWLLAGLLVSGAVFGYLHFKDRFGAPASNLPTPDPAARVRGGSGGEEVAPAVEKPRPKYDFYTLLPEKEVVIPDAELDAQAEAEAQARQRAAAAAQAAAADADGSAPAPAPGTATPDAGAGPPPPDAAATGRGERYLIQAGAFRGQAEAEALKARIAMTGEIARIETAQINGTTVHRVRLGPYPDASALAAAKQALAAHGISAQAIKVK